MTTTGGPITEAAQRLVDRTTTAQKLPVTIQDARVLQKVADIVASGAAPAGGGRHAA